MYNTYSICICKYIVICISVNECFSSHSKRFSVLCTLRGWISAAVYTFTLWSVEHCMHSKIETQKAVRIIYTSSKLRRAHTHTHIIHRMAINAHIMRGRFFNYGHTPPPSQLKYNRFRINNNIQKWKGRRLARPTMGCNRANPYVYGRKEMRQIFSL